MSNEFDFSNKILNHAKEAGVAGLALFLIFLIALGVGFGLFALVTWLFQICWNYLAAGTVIPVLTFWKAAALRIVAGHLFGHTTNVQTK